VNPDVSAQRPTMGFKNGDRVRYSHTNGLVQESTVLATCLDDFCIVVQSALLCKDLSVQECGLHARVTISTVF
jgi:hypothetical protein